MTGSRWELRFCKRDDGWKLSYMKPLKIGPRMVESVRDIYF